MLCQSDFAADHPVSCMIAAAQGGETIADVFDSLKKLVLEFIRSGGFSEEQICEWLDKVWADYVVPRQWSNRPILERAIEQALLTSLKFLVRSSL
jgi:hypothetical protein